MTRTETEVIKNMCEHNLSIQKVAQAMFMHRNAIVYHIERIKEKIRFKSKMLQGFKIVRRDDE